MQINCTKMGPGRCVWCGKEKPEVIDVAFSDDSFVGLMCVADFCKALRMKLAAGPAHQPPRTEIPPGKPHKE
jgi:hypothetical protein